MQHDEAEDEEMGAEDSANDGFMVPDGQLSEDEGLSSVQQELDTLCAEQEGVLASPACNMKLAADPGCIFFKTVQAIQSFNALGTVSSSGMLMQTLL